MVVEVAPGKDYAYVATLTVAVQAVGIYDALGSWVSEELLSECSVWLASSPGPAQKIGKGAW